MFEIKFSPLLTMRQVVWKCGNVVTIVEIDGNECMHHHLVGYS